ncbi:MAG: helix-turn-helix transcriptional regulator [Planctomycetia bacterium]|nr:helix-turn-helix transcriptional regulator [Planctomycetia bacterium]
MKRDKNLLKLGTHIRSLRTSASLSQEQLALLAGIDRSYMGGIERGERNISFLTLARIATALGCDIATITKGIP